MVLRIITDSNLPVVEAYGARGRLGVIHLTVEVQIYPLAVVDSGDVMPVAVVYVRLAVEAAPSFAWDEQACTAEFERTAAAPSL